MDKGHVRIVIDPRVRLVFASYYIKGFWELFGHENISFSRRPFGELDQLKDPDAFNHYVAFKVIEGGREIRIVIDYRDMLNINHNGYEWSDIYGKINLNTGMTDRHYLEKSVALGPAVGIKIWSIPRTYYHCLRNYGRSREHLKVGLRYYMSGYNWQARRPELSVYEPEKAEADYVYFDSSLWRKEGGAETTNAWRASFMRACKASDIHFEGGFFGYKGHPDYEKYKDVLLTKYIRSNEWIKRVKRSTLVFNTPSVHGGHGWKLCEFLAMGKAMISSPILNDLPAPLEHGKHLHLISSEEEIGDAIRLLVSDDGYRSRLEQGARKYYLDYLTPSKEMQRLLEGRVHF